MTVIQLEDPDGVTFDGDTIRRTVRIQRADQFAEIVHGGGTGWYIRVNGSGVPVDPLPISGILGEVCKALGLGVTPERAYRIRCVMRAVVAGLPDAADAMGDP